VDQLAEGYSADCDRCSREAWDQTITGFRDQSLYQAWSYDVAGSDHRQVAHLVLRKEREIVAAAQVRIVTVPTLKAGIAYVRWGPMWRLHGQPDDLQVFRQAARALRAEFSRRRRLVLRLYPWAYRSHHSGLAGVLYEEGYRRRHSGHVDRTLVVDLTASIDDLRAALHQKWRNCLNRAERSGLELVFGEDESLLHRIIAAYWEMVRRKGLVQTTDVDHLLRVHRELPSGNKLKTFLCYQGAQLVAGAAVSAVGTTGIYLLGATSDAGLTSQGSYLVQWSIIKWLKENGYVYYDLNGINPTTNPGTYRFKSGLAGKRGQEVEFLGRFQVSDSRFSSLAVGAGEYVAAGWRQLSTLVSPPRSRRK